MRRFILASLVVHGLGAGLLYLFHTQTVEPSMLPGDVILLSLRTFSEATHERQPPPAPVNEPAQQQPVPIPAARRTVAPRPPAEIVPDEEEDHLQEETGEVMQAQTDDTDVMESVRAAVYSALRASFSYPRRARLRGWEGTVIISLRILPDGHLSDIRVADSSGISVLDRAALRSLSGISLPQVVVWMNGREIDMLIPVEYRLTDS